MRHMPFRTSLNHLGFIYMRWFPGTSAGKESASMWETWVWSLGWEDPLEKGMANHSSILALRIPWTEEPGRFMGSQRVGRGWVTFTLLFSSVTQSCPTLCNPMDWSMPDLPVHHQLPAFAQTPVHLVSDAIQPFHPLSSPSPSAFNLS